MTRSNEARAKMRAAKLGTKHSAETIKKMSDAQKRRYAENRERAGLAPPDNEALADTMRALAHFVDMFSVRVPTDGLCKDRLCGIFGSPGAEYFFLVAGNSYDEMALGHLRHSLEYARAALTRAGDVGVGNG